MTNIARRIASTLLLLCLVLPCRAQDNSDLIYWYNKYNQRYFHAELPDSKDIAIEWADLNSHCKDFKNSVLAQKKCITRGLTQRAWYGRFKIQLDPNFNRDEISMHINLLHEMAHVATWRDDHGEHGKSWQWEIQRLIHEGAYRDLL